MRKALLGAVTAAIILSLEVTSAFAAGPGCGRGFVDADGDGVCDNASSRCIYVDEDGDGVCDNVSSRCIYVDEDGDGVCDTCGASHTRAKGRNFVDADGDGVCDFYTSGQGRGCGYGRGAQGGRGNGFRGGRGR